MVNGYMGNSGVLKSILTRLDRLEKTVFGHGKKKTTVKKPVEFKGPKGGITLLISRGFLNRRKQAPEVRGELEKSGYDYRIQVVQTALNRLSKNKGPLTTLTENGKKVYVKRK